MRWNVEQFFNSVALVADRYERENTWFRWSDRATYIANAWKLYRAANENALGTLVLGDAKIRTSSDLLMNFGVTSGSGISDEREQQQILALASKRQGLAGPRSGAVVKVLGRGSILNDQCWTPLLNDAFILGGVHGGQDFHWAEEGFDQFSQLGEREFLQRRAKFGAAAPQYVAALKRDAAYYKGRWKQYILSHTNFWSGGLVRVFARELIGLETFGYSPVFTSLGVSFTPGGSASPGTFEGYLNGLAVVNFSANDPAAINPVLGEFLFGDSKALTNLSAAAMPKPAGPHLLKTSAKPPGWPK